MTIWKSFGSSVIGPGHIAAGQPNQDAWAAFHHIWGDGIVVSDGLGSKPFSNFGSQAACLAAAHTVHACRRRGQISRASLSEGIRKTWLSFIAPLVPQDCAATCIFAFRLDAGIIYLGMLGDGLAAVVKTDGSVASLSDDKSGGFSNITDALSPGVTEKNWQWLTVLEKNCESIVLCTDGVADDLKDQGVFVREFTNSHRGLPSVSAARRTREMLENWPTPKHSDDKTIACLFREEVADEPVR